jgi:protein-disulfide isomerase
VLKEFPILGPGSLEAARVAVAVRMQDPEGTRYLEFHKKLLGNSMPPNRALALSVAREAGLDVARLEKDEASPEVNETIEESAALARTLGLNGTPSYVISDQVVVGAVGIASLKDRIQAARK